MKSKINNIYINCEVVLSIFFIVVGCVLDFIPLQILPTSKLFVAGNPEKNSDVSRLPSSHSSAAWKEYQQVV